MPKKVPTVSAASCDHEDIVRLLLEFDADVTLRDADGETPEDCATSQHIRDMLMRKLHST